ncbi:MAG: ABC transporter substrate-binding protein [Candidatus Krumholzibacteriota bacterium]|nr:ABC transporter substrate-binding protein [Candidatus Krumholzibacteriota bacterium]
MYFFERVTGIRSLYKAFLLGAVFTSIFLSFPARGAEDNWLHISIAGKPTTLYPWNLDDVYATMIVQSNIVEGLVKYDEKDMVIKPHLAVDWEVEEAGREWIFNLREGVMFHDGSPLTADDVVESIRRISNFFKDEIEKTGPLQVRFRFPGKTAGLLKTLSKVYFAIAKEDEDGTVLGTGPFSLEKRNGSNKIRLNRFSSYWGEKPRLDGVTFHCLMDIEESVQSLREGKIDVVYMIPLSLAAEIEADGQLILSRLQGATFSYLHINTRKSLLDIKEFRYALNIALDRERIIESIFHGQADRCRGILPPVICKHNKQVEEYPYDPDRARQIVQKYLPGQERKFKMIGLPFPRPYCPDPAALAKMVIGYLERTGIEIEYVTTQSWEEWLDIVGGDDYDFVMAGWVLDSMSPDDFFSDIFYINGNQWTIGTRWENADFTSLILEARTKVSVRKQWELYHRAEEIIIDECPWIILAHPHRLSAYRKGISGLKFSPTTEFGLREGNKDIW